jgi:3,4-dihydroxy 2-butanone 4-phosphate synthase/GTP cyclohydrolase II
MTICDIERDLAGRTVDAALAAIARGEFVVVLDDEDRENEGDLIMAAELVTPAAITFMVRHTSGLVCVGMTGVRLDQLELPLMIGAGSEALGTAFTVSVDSRDAGKGASACGRAATIRALMDPQARPTDFERPGYVFPLRARPNGVLERPGHTEAAVDLARLAGLRPAGVLCEVVNPDGTMSRGPELTRFAAEHGLVIITIQQLIAYRLRHEQLVRSRAAAALPTPWGEFTVRAYESLVDGIEHVALVKGDVSGDDPVLVRVHSECLTGDILRSLRCDCGAQLDLALEAVAAEERGVLIYLRGHEGRGIGIAAKIAAYELQELGLDTVEANLALGLPVDSRQFGVAAQILTHLGVRRIRLMTNNPAKYESLSAFGVEITERVPLIAPTTQESVEYLQAKRDKLRHQFPVGLRA